MKTGIKAIPNHKVKGKEIVYKETADELLEALNRLLDVTADLNIDKSPHFEMVERVAKSAIKKATA